LSLRFFITVFVFTVCLGLISYFLDVNDEKNQFTPKLNEWSQLDKRKIHKINLSNRNTKLDFSKNISGTWVMTEPQKIIADQTKIHKVLRTILEMDVARELPLLKDHMEIINKNGLNVVLQFEEKKIECVIFKMELMPRHIFIKFKNSDLVLKCVDGLNFVTILNKKAYWTRRLFPFTINSIKHIVYRRDAKEIFFSNTEKGWESNIVPGQQWQNFFSKLHSAACVSYIEGKVNGSLKASYEIHFQSGRKSKIDLIFVEKKGLVAYYSGTNRGQVVSNETANAFFPKVLQ
jgi:hypothetical protein